MTKFLEKFGKIAVILGSQWGDEGKGKLIDILSEEYDFVVRATGGANAGHTIYIADKENSDKTKKYVFHLIPSGMLHEKPICVIGNGVVMHIPTLFEEMEILKNSGIKTEGRLLMSDRMHLVFNYHLIADGIQEERKGTQKVGTTKKGIGPAYTDKIRRTGIRLCDLLSPEIFKQKYYANLESLKMTYKEINYDHEKEIKEHLEAIEIIKPYIINSTYFLNEQTKNNKSILIEGANGTLLDIDHGTYPYVTSSNASVGGVIAGTGLGATKLTHVIGIMKAYCTRVGAGPFPSELQDKTGELLREAGGEYGATTGRPRRCGWFDAIASKYSVLVNNFDSLNLTKLDVLNGINPIKIVTAYKYNGKTIKEFPADSNILDKIEIETIEMAGWNEDISKIKTYNDLPENTKKYIEKIEELIECKISSIGVGMKRDDMIYKF